MVTKVRFCTSTVQHKTLAELELQENWRRKLWRIGNELPNPPKFGGWLVDKTGRLAMKRQIRQSFLLPKFCAVQYIICVIVNMPYLQRLPVKEFHDFTQKNTSHLPLRITWLLM